MNPFVVATVSEKLDTFVIYRSRCFLKLVPKHARKYRILRC